MTFECDALLFDLDGTLVDSLPAVDRAWSAWALRNGLNPIDVVSRIHGRRSIDSLRMIAPHLDVDEENAWLRNREATDTEGVRALEGAAKFLSGLPPELWAIVTSGTDDVAVPRIRAAGLPAPRTCVYGNDVANGKPAPDAFLLAAQKLNAAPERCIVFEDTVAGLRAGSSAGCRTLGVRILPGEDLSSESDVVISGYDEIRVAFIKNATSVVLFVRE